MDNSNTLGILFYIRKDKKRSDNTIPIFLRITVNGERAELSVKRNVLEDKWDEKASRVKGNSENARTINTALDKWKNRVYKAQETLIDDDEVVTATAIKTILDGNYKQQHTLIEAFDTYIAYIKSLEGKDYAPATIKRYETTKDHMIRFIGLQYGLTDIRLRKLDHAFIRELELYFRNKRKCNHNTTVKYIKNLKAVVNDAIKAGWLIKDPFMSYKITLDEVKRDRLTADELKAIEELDIKITRLELVRDLFVFSCYTGLAYVDLSKLQQDNLSIGIDRNTWIVIDRQKTDTHSQIPLLPKAEELIAKYDEYSDDAKKGCLFPMLTNQKLNAYLKEIADLAEIDKNLTFHLARHTFATTVTLSNDVPIETVSKMLGHKSIRTTQIYAKVVERKVSDDMEKLRKKLEEDNNETKKKKNGL